MTAVLRLLGFKPLPALVGPVATTYTPAQLTLIGVGMKVNAR